MDLNYLLNDWFLFNDLSPSLLVSGTHDPWLVVLSVVVAIAASCVALQLAGLARTKIGEDLVKAAEEDMASVGK